MPEQLGHHAHRKGLEVQQPLEDSAAVRTEGIVCGHQMSVQDVLLQSKACFPSDIFWPQSLLKCTKVPVTF